MGKNFLFSIWLIFGAQFALDEKGCLAEFRGDRSCIRRQMGRKKKCLLRKLQPAILRRVFSGWPQNFVNLIFSAKANIAPNMGSIGPKKIFSHTFLLNFRRLVWEKKFFEGISLIFGVKLALDEKP